MIVRRWEPLQRRRAAGAPFAAALAFLLLLGCAAPGKRLEAPYISLTRIEVDSTTVFETVMTVTLRLLNTNDVPLTLKGADVRLTVDGKDVAHGVSRMETTLPAYDTALVPMTLYSSMIDLAQGLLKIRDQEPLKYGIRGNVRIEGGFLMPSTLPFSHTGELSLDGIHTRKQR
ncbi:MULTISPECIES: LEA type 2 family protein [Desulfococcus]|jgi:LEA14-like dessication related protein|nr:LEA type 2 family protein [Desulfococcus multivorans]AOY59651.1 uncharacterized protein Dmul_28800 [Desulfococcus multivorans]MDX9819799.1 LEA type 2 family protein [Desulfococcus multivorans]